MRSRTVSPARRLARARWMLAFLLFGWGSPALAGPPLATDDPASAARGELQAILAFAGSERVSAQTFDGPLLDLAYGLTPRLELDAVLAVSHAEEAGGEFAHGATLVLGFKWQLVAREDWGVAFTPAGGFDLGTGEDAAGFVPLSIEYRPRAWRLGAEAGYVPRQSEPDGWQAGVYAARSFGSRAELMAELMADAFAETDDPSLGWQLGVDFALAPALHLLAAAGSGIRGGGDGPRTDWTLYLGVQLMVDVGSPL